jgi:hypothetical protein
MNHTREHDDLGGAVTMNVPVWDGQPFSAKVNV